MHTDHKIEDYIEKDEYYIKVNGVLTPDHEFILDIGKMCYDIFGSGELEGAAGFDFEGGGVEFSEFDEKNLAHAITIEVRDADNYTAYSIVKMFDCSMQANWLPDDEHDIKVGESYMHLDLAVLILYGLEQAEANPRRDIFADISFVSNYGSKDARRWHPHRICGRGKGRDKPGRRSGYDVLLLPFGAQGKDAAQGIVVYR